ncbi:MAG: hypothetical protein LBI20_02100 [Holosporales bacterium]|jgi:hypothetical protein|nr:hypothetical protein [Holosporales bacterium]
MNQFILGALCLGAMAISSVYADDSTPIPLDDISPIGPVAVFDTSRYCNWALVGASAAFSAIYIAKKSCDNDDIHGSSAFPWFGALTGGALALYFAKGKTGSEDNDQNKNFATKMIEKLPTFVAGVTVGSEIAVKCAEVGRFISRSDKYSTKSSPPQFATPAKVCAISLVGCYSAIVAAETFGKLCHTCYQKD